MESLLLKLCRVFCRYVSIDCLFNSISQYECVCLTILLLNANRRFRTFHLYQLLRRTPLFLPLCAEWASISPGHEAEVELLSSRTRASNRMYCGFFCWLSFVLSPQGLKSIQWRQIPNYEQQTYLCKKMLSILLGT